MPSNVPPVDPFPTAYTPTELGVSRFPPNVEVVAVEAGPTRVWLTMRRNDTELAFPLDPAAARHVAGLLIEAAAELA